MRRSVTGKLVATLTVWTGLITNTSAQEPYGTNIPNWEPAKTRAFIVCLAQFQSKDVPSFTTDDRLDDRFVAVLERRGVPRSQIVFLKHNQATTKNIQNEFTTFLRRSKPGELLLFYFGSHGGYDPKEGTCWFVSFEGSLPFTWVSDAIERDFQGSHALLAADSCHSGGIVDLIRQRKSRIAYAALSSTYKHQTAWSGWRFLQCLIRGLEGHPALDPHGSGYIDLKGLAEYTGHYMAFTAEGKPGFATANGFDPRMRLAAVRSKHTDPQLGKLVEIQTGTQWARAEIVDVRDSRFKVHYTADTKTDKDEWVTKSQVRSPVFEHFPIGTKVEFQGASSRKWFAGAVVDTWESLHLGRYDGYGPEYNEWFGPSRIRPSFVGTWSGRWANDVGQEGKDGLVLNTKTSELLTGSWTGDIKVTGERLGRDVFVLEARTPNRFYRGVGRMVGPRLTIEYLAQADKDRYFGWSTLQQSGAIASARREPRAQFSGKWSGSYENSKGGVGDDTLEMAEDDGKLSGVWAGLTVKGERLGNTTCYLVAAQGGVVYRVVGRVNGGRLTLDYSAASKTTRYTGRSVMNR